MRMRRFMPIWLSLGLLLVGCKSYGPRFDPHQTNHQAYARELQEAHFPGAEKVDEQGFTSIERTNRVQPDWLKPPSDFFRLGPGDVIDIEMLAEPESRAGAFLGPDGKIYYNLLPGTFVWGLTLSEARDLLEKELGRYLRVKPEIAVTLRAVGSKRIWILGGVQNPGVYSLATPLTLLEAISTAGGTLAAAGSKEEAVDLKSSFVLREGQLLPVDFHRLLRQGDLSQNIYLQPNDFVYLRPASARNVYVLGAVPVPNVLPYTPETTLVSALSSVGGTVPFAYRSHVAIVRGSLTEPRIAIVDYGAIIKGKARDVRLEAGDIVYVPFSPYRRLAAFTEQIIYQFVQTIAINEGNRAVLVNPAPVGTAISGTPAP